MVEQADGFDEASKSVEFLFNLFKEKLEFSTLTRVRGA